MRTQSLNHSTYELQYHIVWGTKYRRKWLKDYVKQELEQSLKATIKKYPTLHLVAMNTDEDHVHLQIEIPPNITIADAVRTVIMFVILTKDRFCGRVVCPFPAFFESFYED